MKLKAGMGKAGPTTVPKSLNYDKRKKATRKIEQENLAFARRLMTGYPSCSFCL